MQIESMKIYVNVHRAVPNSLHVFILSTYVNVRLLL